MLVDVLLVLDELVLELLLQVVVMVLHPQRFEEIGGIDFHIHCFGHTSSADGVG